MGVILGSGVNSPPDDPVGTPLIGWHNLVTIDNITAEQENDGFPITNAANPATNLFWSGPFVTGSYFIAIDTSSYPGVINYVGIAGHNLGSAGIFISVYDFGVSPPVQLANFLPTDDSPLIIRIPSAVYTTLKIGITFVVATGTPRIAVIYCGSLLVLERGIKVDVAHVPITYGLKTNVISGMSESGNFLGRIVLGESRQSRAEFFGFTSTFFHAALSAFLSAAQERPFFWAWAPDDYPLETGFVWLTNNPQPELSPDHRRIAFTLDMAGIA